MDKKARIARLSIASNVFLTGGKLVVGLIMNSVSVLSEALHSGLDLLASLVAFLSVCQSGKPADDRHRYGHGKFENVAAIFEAMLILGAAGLIVFKSISKFTAESEIKSLGLGAAVMAVSATVNFAVSTMIMRVAKETDSPALAADAWHLRTDVITSLGVLAGIVGIKLTGWVVLDPLIALGVALLIGKAGFDLIRESLGSILDVRLPDEEEDQIRAVLEEYEKNFVRYGQLRTRKAGSQRYVDLHLVVPRQNPIVEAHALCDRIEESLQERLPGIQVIIHTEPCRPEHGDCKICSRLRYNEAGGAEAGKCTDCRGCEVY